MGFDELHGLVRYLLGRIRLLLDVLQILHAGCPLFPNAVLLALLGD